MISINSRVDSFWRLQGKRGFDVTELNESPLHLRCTMFVKNRRTKKTRVFKYDYWPSTGMLLNLDTKEKEITYGPERFILNKYRKYKLV